MKCIYNDMDCTVDFNDCCNCRWNTSTDTEQENRRKLISAKFPLKSGNSFIDRKCDEYIDWLGGRPHTSDTFVEWLRIANDIDPLIAMMFLRPMVDLRIPK